MIRKLSLIFIICTVVLAEESQCNYIDSSSASTNEFKPLAPWKVTATIGMSLTKGNSDTLTISGGIDANREWLSNEVILGSNITYGEKEGKVNASSFKGFVQYNRLLGSKLYLLGRLDGFHDDMAKVSYRVNWSGGVGYAFIKSSHISLRGEVGPAFVIEKVGSISSSYWSLRIGEQFSWQISSFARLWERLDYTPQTDRFENYVVNTEVGLETRITYKLSLRITTLSTYRNITAPSRQKYDFMLITGLSYTF